MTRQVDADYLVVGAGAAGMAFVDALVADADVRVAMVERRAGVGGHWREAYPFVRLHQASGFYGVASTVLGGGRVQTTGPEAGLFERAGQSAICSYYADVLADRLLGPVEHPRLARAHPADRVRVDAVAQEPDDAVGRGLAGADGSTDADAERAAGFRVAVRMRVVG